MGVAGVCGLEGDGFRLEGRWVWLVDVVWREGGCRLHCSTTYNLMVAFRNIFYIFT